jgi:hypothetical protein
LTRRPPDAARGHRDCDDPINLKEVDVLFFMVAVVGIGVGAAFVTVRRRRKGQAKIA